ncbi:MAG: glycosyltransferase [Pseudomonadota bacterium]
MSPKDTPPALRSYALRDHTEDFLNGAPALIDITRSLSRAGLGPATGIDRVERAYIDHALAWAGESWFLARALGGFVLLDAHGMRHLLSHLDGDRPWGFPDFLSHFARRQSRATRRAEATARRLATALIPRPALATALRRALPRGFVYLNVGHSNQTASTLDQVRRGGAGRVCLMIHDLIPLDLPQTTRPGTPARMARSLRAALPKTDVLIYNSHHTARRVRAFLDECDQAVLGITAPLGITAQPLRAAPSGPPAFLVLGTIEPRKNHALLLDVWDALVAAPPCAGLPHLHIVGRRGWQTEALISRLEGHPLYGTLLHEHGALPDQCLWPLMARMRGLLFPSLGEGYGLPLAEALHMGMEVVASNLDVFHEIGHDLPVYLDPHDVEGWARAIRALCDRPHRAQPYDAPRWSDHFNLVTQGLETARQAH